MAYQVQRISRRSAMVLSQGKRGSNKKARRRMWQELSAEIGRAVRGVLREEKEGDRGSM